MKGGLHVGWEVILWQNGCVLRLLPLRIDFRPLEFYVYCYEHQMTHELPEIDIEFHGAN